jgi:uncharacterized protein (DUF302 family)
MKQPFRFWMTGSVAVVVAASGMGRGLVTRGRNALSRSSRFRLPETVQRIEACARKRGLSVFARLGECYGPHPEAGDSTFIVFESSAGGTPVLMEAPDARPELPLSVCVRSSPLGDTEVLFNGDDWSDLPPRVARDLTELPVLVADALRG